MICEIDRIECENGVKLLMALHDNVVIEVAFFYYFGSGMKGTHICMPSQVGCPVGCYFCATTRATHPYIRNMTGEEMIEIISYILNICSSKGLHIDILSFSGHGEPLLNLTAVSQCIQHFSGLIERFYITTVGIPNAFEDALKFSDKVHYYISLHGSSDAERHLIIPNHPYIATMDDLKQFSLSLLMRGSQVTFNYMLTPNNTSLQSAQRLANFMSSFSTASVRFTPVFPTGISSNYAEADADSFIAYFKELIDPNRIKWRRSVPMGSEIGIACGQMRARYLKLNGE